MGDLIRKLVRAEAHSDDYKFQVEFDAYPWFKQASDEELVELAGEDFGQSLPADRVAQFMEGKVPELKKMFAYLRSDKAKRRPERIGFEVIVNSNDAEAWVRQNRPHLLR